MEYKNNNNNYMNFSEKQLHAYNLMVAGKNIFITGQGGVGKCLGIDTPVIMYDGTTKMIQDIDVGEFVMGDDSNKRTVLSVTHGYGNLYKVSNDNGDYFIANEDHILTFKVMRKIVKKTNTYTLFWGNEYGGLMAKHFNNVYEAEIYGLSIPLYADIPLIKCLHRSDTWKNYFRTVYATLRFEDKDVEVDPYIFGLWLGFESMSASNYFLSCVKNMKSYLLLIKNKRTGVFRRFLDKYGLHGNKYIPTHYKINSFHKRRSLLNGIMDACDISRREVFEYVFGEDVAHDMHFVAGSLGFLTQIKRIDNGSYKISINSGYNSIINKDTMIFPLNDGNLATSKINIKYMGVGRYYGFELDKNHRFVLGNFMISHNSHVITAYISRYRDIKKIGVTSLTGVSALLIKGTTLHSYTGIKLGKGSAYSLAQRIKTDKFALKRWRETDVLIVDEVSMFKPELFDKLEEIARIVRRNDLPFGGIQLILSGDFCQLPFVTMGDEDKERFCCDAEAWARCIECTVYINEIIRQRDLVFQTCLNNVRLGNVNDDVRNILNSRLKIQLHNEFDIVPTKLYPLNADVDDENEHQMNLLGRDGREFFEYVMDITVVKSKSKYKDIIIDTFLKNCMMTEVLQLCVGAQVMLLVNLDLEQGLANGSRGIVVGFVDDIPLVKFLNGNEHLIEHFLVSIEEDDKVVLSAYQIPLKVAFAISIHKCQGITLDYVEVDLGNVFEYGQAYTALSRVKNLEGLSIRRINYGKIIANPRAIRFYEELERKTEE